MPHMKEAWPKKILIERDAKTLVASVVDLLEERLRRRLSEDSPKPLGLATGRTMRPVYIELISRLRSWPSNELEKLLGSWCSFNLDEYVGLTDKNIDSYLAYMAKYVGEPLQLTPDKLRVPNGLAQDPQIEASLYGEELRMRGGVSIQLLGIGINGHLGFNEPPCGPNTPCRLVRLSETTRIQNAFAFNGDLNKVPVEAITLGMAEILSAEEIHLIVTGTSKAHILNCLLSQPSSNDLPESWLRQHKNLYVWADHSAFGQCKRGMIASK